MRGPLKHADQSGVLPRVESREDLVFELIDGCVGLSQNRVSMVGEPQLVGPSVAGVAFAPHQIAMHSARELMGANDVPAYAAALHAFLSPER